jgi:methyltransferase (TIGR00027 family)
MQGSFSKTALLVAGYRARATEKADHLCNDPWARGLAGDEGLALTEMYDRVVGHMDLWMGVRTAFLDGEVRAYTSAQGGAFSQVVILGAGLDSRAARLGKSGVRFFEVDHPSTQAYKQGRLRALAGYPVEAATYVPCDFEHDDFLDQLAQAGFRKDSPALFIWEGVTYYLTEPAVRATLSRIAKGCAPASTVVFDYVMRKLVEGVRIQDRQKEMLKLLGDIGEPFRFGVNDVLPLLYEEGFRHVRTVSFDEACLTLTGTYERERQFRFQLFALASRAAPPATL